MVVKMDIKNILNEYDEKLFDKTNRRIFVLDRKWTKSVSSESGVYAFFNKDEKILYVGETGSLRGRMSDVRRTQNHSFRRAIGNKLYSDKDGFIKATSKKKFSTEIETDLDKYMAGLYVNIIPLPFGRKEVEEYFIDKYDPEFNTKKKRNVMSGV